MLNELQAEDILRSVFEGRLSGAGQMKLTDAKRAMQKVERAAGGARRKRPANQRALRSAGIGVVHRKRGDR